jgi:hypothetical protein
MYFHSFMQMAVFGLWWVSERTEDVMAFGARRQGSGERLGTWALHCHDDERVVAVLLDNCKTVDDRIRRTSEALRRK